MPRIDNRVDDYIANAKPFAKPILTHLRELVHKVCPDVEETIRWGIPNFDYHGMLCSIAAFSGHCVFGLYKAGLLTDPDGSLKEIGKTAMGNTGKIRDLNDLPSEEILTGWILEAMALNETGTPLPKRPKNSPSISALPQILAQALAENNVAWLQFENFRPSQKKEYADWIEEAKTEATRNKRLQQAMEWITEGKPRYWKYIITKP